MNIQEFQQSLPNVTQACTALSKQFPNDPMIGSICAQLNFLTSWNENGMNWNEGELTKLNFGLLASKSVDEGNRSLAQLLYRLANFIDDSIKTKGTSR